MSGAHRSKIQNSNILKLLAEHEKGKDRMRKRVTLWCTPRAPLFAAAFGGEQLIENGSSI